MTNNHYKISRINSFLLAILLCLPCVVSIVNAIVSMSNISVIISLLIMIISVIINKGVRIHKTNLLYYYLIISVFLISLALNGQSCLNYLLHFLIFGSTALVLTSSTYEEKDVIDISILIYVVFIIFFLLYIKDQYVGSDDYYSKQMGIAYSFLPGIVWALIRLIYGKLFLNNTLLNKLISLFVLIGAIYIILFLTMTRGALISMMFASLAILMVNVDKNKRVIYYFVFGAFVITVMAVSWNYLLQYTQDTSIAALKKLSSLAENNEDLTTGRADLYLNAVNIIRRYPILGRGVGYFEMSNEIYSHQFFLQLLCEVGVIGTLIFARPIFAILKTSLFSSLSETQFIPLGLVVSTLLMLQYSNVHWYQPNFWVLFFLYPYSKNAQCNMKNI